MSGRICCSIICSVKEQPELFESIPADKFAILTKDELVEFNKIQQDLLKQQQKQIKELINKLNQAEEQSLLLDEKYLLLKNKVFGRSSEKSGKKKDKKEKKDKKKRVLLPSERYPNIDILDQEVSYQEAPTCSCCNEKMIDSGMTEDSEFLTVIPAKYRVVRQRRKKYRCGHCHGDIQTTPAPRRIRPGSAYSDEMILDASLSKYCDLIPMERYAAIAGRAGVMDLPPHSLIQASHYLADFVEGAADKVKEEVLNSEIVYADETVQKLLELKKNGRLWGFSNLHASYFEIHATRAGDVASEFLKDSKCRYLMSDVYCGYQKAVRETNVYRQEKNLPLIINIYCNAHVRRKFKDSSQKFPDEAEYFITCYRKIYRLEQHPPDNLERKKIRQWQDIYFRLMKRKAEETKNEYSTKSSLYVAMNYLLKNYREFTLFMKLDLPIDNNHEERQMRNPVIGRKTWYGTHSARGAKTAEIMFTLVESCKLNKINPRQYFKELVANLHQGKGPYSPYQYSQM